MTETQTIPQKTIAALKSAGLRLTPQRLAICQLLAESDEHPTAQDIFEALKPRFPSLSLATVYNTLETLVSLGVVHALGQAGDAKMHYDGDTEPHVNLVCISCHSIIDLPSQYVAALQDEVHTNSGYHLIGASVMYYGLCPKCQAQQEE